MRKLHISLLVLATAGVAFADPPSPEKLLPELRKGGYVLFIRHPKTNADQADTDPLHLDNIKAALEIRKACAMPTRIVVSMIRQEAIEHKLDQGIRFWLESIGVDDVITRKYLTWDDNTTLPHGAALDRHLYSELPQEKAEPCVWPFERLNVDTLGRVALCGQDISFRTSELFPNANQASLKEIWRGEMFDWYRRMHLEGRGAECFPCPGARHGSRACVIGSTVGYGC